MPLLASYKPFGRSATRSWVSSFWETLDAYQFRLQLDYPTWNLPRKGDVLIVEIGEALCLSHEEPCSFHRCQIVWNLLFLSDLASSNGRHIEGHFLFHPTSLYEPRSSQDFPAERPTLGDWRNWAAIWTRYTGPGLTLHRPLGDWIHPTNRLWQWVYDRDTNVVTQMVDGGWREHFQADTGHDELAAA